MYANVVTVGRWRWTASGLDGGHQVRAAAPSPGPQGEETAERWPSLPDGLVTGAKHTSVQLLEQRDFLFSYLFMFGTMRFQIFFAWSISVDA